MRGLVLAAAAAAAVVGAADASDAFAYLDTHSFRPPFARFDAVGMRTIDNWRKGGDATINENFVRLTPDRQNKKGWLWSRSKMAADVWTATVRFRVSGQGKRLFGDGLAFWFTTSAYPTDGPVHGFADVFTGFGVAFDTYVNSEPGHVHKDIQLLSSDGTKSVKAAGEHGGGTEANVVGCDADFRYWEGRQDFSPSQNISAARITFDGRNNTVSVHVDVRNKGEWRPCFENAPLAAPVDWWRRMAYIGLTASTGDLADTHDVLSVITGMGDAPAPDDITGGPSGFPAFVTTGDTTLDQAVRAATARESGKYADALSKFKHDLEHDLESVQDNLRTALKKLQDQEADDRKRIQQLEDKVKQIVESALDRSIATRLANLERLLETKLDARASNLSAELSSHRNTGLVWLAVLSFILLALAAIGWNRYTYIRKKHFL